MLSTIVRLVCAVTLLALTITPADAQTTMDKRIHFTFNAPVTLPGVTLPPGSYTFQIANPLQNRSVVQVRSRDGNNLYATFLTIPYQAPTIPEEPEIRFMERRAEVPFAVSAWWYPGDRTGFEPVYPREQAERLARMMNDPILTTSATAAALADANAFTYITRRP
jgi:hypothetical protein